MDDAAIKALKDAKIRLENRIDNIKKDVDHYQLYLNNILDDLRKSQDDLKKVESSIIKLESFK